MTLVVKVDFGIGQITVIRDYDFEKVDSATSVVLAYNLGRARPVRYTTRKIIIWALSVVFVSPFISIFRGNIGQKLKIGPQK